MEQSPRSATDFLRQRLAFQIALYGQRRNLNRLLAFIARVCVTVFGGLTTVLLGLRGNEMFSGVGPSLSAIALVSSATVTLFSTWEGFFDHRWLWIRYSITLARLREISDELEYLSAGSDPIPQDKLDAIYNQLRDTIRETRSEWSAKRTGEKTTEHRDVKP